MLREHWRPWGRGKAGTAEVRRSSEGQTADQKGRNADTKGPSSELDPDGAHAHLPTTPYRQHHTAAAQHARDGRPVPGLDRSGRRVQAGLGSQGGFIWCLLGSIDPLLALGLFVRCPAYCLRMDISSHSLPALDIWRPREETVDSSWRALTPVGGWLPGAQGAQTARAKPRAARNGPWPLGQAGQAGHGCSCLGRMRSRGVPGRAAASAHSI